ncbi:MAG: DegV family EDD domain-containing protein [Syntrophales bacterium]|jgi:DegV family protein with EDD domain|nr:DegV family EDD domain-containing protein [Syntrophales bacterium]MDD4339550.1 DegV family protein [Syntrophales bacterium]HOG07736.1 DegV family protein [Syntrophales bacterium]HOS76568.1 DegV family protein [Syntrophales bacterium]HPB71314.1 DegV family protein [Syntrophales bacterium]
METSFSQALIAGVERVSAWADLLDDINVFPVADGDTGRNLVISLSPLRQITQGRDRIIRELLLSARGNSGNIAARFFSGLLMADAMHNLPDAIREGRNRAWQAVNDPKPGTMLTVFDALVAALEEAPGTYDAAWRERVLDRLEGAVRETPELLPKLKAAGVVDAGALGVFIYLDGFFSALTGNIDSFKPITDIFRDSLKISSEFQEAGEGGYCVDTVLKGAADDADTIRRLAAIGESVVVLKDGDYLKVHLHARDGQKARGELGAFGDVVRWFVDDLDAQVHSFRRRRVEAAVHILTDAAGSVNRQNTAQLGITLLDSYLTVGDKCLPETHFAPEELYDAMRRGVKVSTSQASVFERHQYYQSVLERYPRVLYLCVGSVFTGNYSVAMDWKKTHDPEDRLTVIDTQAASGRLGLMSLAAARFSLKTRDAEAVIRYARENVDRCEEYVFLDKLQYLAAGGRLSKTSAFFGDMLRMKPVISPLAEGAKKMGVVRTQADQVDFAQEKLAAALSPEMPALIMLEYSDNRTWVAESVQPEIARRYPAAEIVLHPLSLTSGAHMGPGTWAVAFLPAGE